MQRWIAGGVSLGAGVAWLVIDRILLVVYPLSWGGPNFGGGGLSALAQLAVVSGFAMLISDPASPAQRNTPQIIPAPDGYAPREPGRRARSVTLLVDGALIVALMVLCLATVGAYHDAR